MAASLILYYGEVVQTEINTWLMSMIDKAHKTGTRVMPIVAPHVLEMQGGYTLK